MKEKELIDARQAIELIACVKLFLFDPIDLECDIDDSRNVLRVNIELLKEEKKTVKLLFNNSMFISIK
jgi:hypothetical protein